VSRRKSKGGNHSTSRRGSTTPEINKEKSTCASRQEKGATAGTKAGYNDLSRVILAKEKDVAEKEWVRLIAAPACEIGYSQPKEGST